MSYFKNRILKIKICFIYKILIAVYIPPISLLGNDGHSIKHNKIVDKYSF